MWPQASQTRAPDGKLIIHAGPRVHATQGAGVNGRVHTQRRAGRQNDLDQAGRLARREWRRRRDQAAFGSVRRRPGCRHLNTGKAPKHRRRRSRLRWQQRLPPVVQLTGANAVLARHLRRRSAWRQALRRDRLLLLNRPPTPPFAAGDQLDRRHMSALTTTRMSALWLPNCLAWLRVRLHEANELNFQPQRHVGTPQR